jgi:uncharacterized membrane protein YidH (DUF202 family)
MSWVTPENSRYLFEIGVAIFSVSLGVLILITWNAYRLERIMKRSSRSQEENEDH